jgi:cytochrome c biogenesis protein CcdA/thiol-disulfide isomerase/thioredoxin
MHEALLALFEGFGLILSPCILPILPIVLAASLDGGKKRPVGIIIGFIVSFSLFALLARQLIQWLQIDTQIIQNAALLMLGILGVVMLVPRLDALLSARMKGIANFGDQLTTRVGRGDGLVSGVMIGCLIGLIWTPCAGPIMAVAVVQIIQAKTDFNAALIVLMFVTGAAIPMLTIALTGRVVMQKFGFLKTYAVRLRQGLGAVILAGTVLIYSGVANQLLAGSPASEMSAEKQGHGLIDGLDRPVAAPEFADIQDWVNSKPLTMAALRGKVVLVDFWTYSCINCVRTLPYVTAWDRKYRDKGLVIVGIHAPEFAFEKKLGNVQDAVKAHGIHYPVALDNNLATWSAFNNRYWPAHYLINQQGQIVYTHFGEGHYDSTEQNIRTLLGLKDGGGVDVQPSAVGGTGLIQSPETYLGYARTENFSSDESLSQDKSAQYSFPDFLALNHWALAGQWQVEAQNITAKEAGAKLRYNFIAGRVFLVLGSADGKPVKVRLTLNGKPLGTKAGQAVKADGELTVTGETLYELINQGGVSNGLLELTAESAGLQAYAFTFGG